MNVVYDIQETDFNIPALSLQVLVENAVKHGICKKPEGGTVTIRTERRGQDIILTVQDTGERVLVQIIHCPDRFVEYYCSLY